MKIKIKKLHPDAVIPKYAKDGDGFVRNVKTYIFTYNVVTFKR